MRKPNLRVGVAILALCSWAFIGGCGESQSQERASDARQASEVSTVAEQAREVAETSLGKQAEVLVHGNLAQNGLEQVLVVNRVSGRATGSASNIPSNDTPPNSASSKSGSVFVTRAAVLQKENGKWSEVLLCDDHLKNPSGYLGGSHVGRVSGWRMEYRQDPQTGLELTFSPADRLDADRANADESSEQKSATFDVRWNKNSKRYQSFDQSHERYLSEVPSLETPQSVLR
jgi:hypothetical protein